MSPIFTKSPNAFESFFHSIIFLYICHKGFFRGDDDKTLTFSVMKPAMSLKILLVFLLIL